MSGPVDESRVGVEEITCASTGRPAGPDLVSKVEAAAPGEGLSVKSLRFALAAAGQGASGPPRHTHGTKYHRRRTTGDGPAILILQGGPRP